MKNGKETKILGADHREQKPRNYTGSLEVLAYGQVTAREFLGSRTGIKHPDVEVYILLQSPHWGG